MALDGFTFLGEIYPQQQRPNVAFQLPLADTEHRAPSRTGDPRYQWQADRDRPATGQLCQCQSERIRLRHRFFQTLWRGGGGGATGRPDRAAPPGRTAAHRWSAAGATKPPQAATPEGGRQHNQQHRVRGPGAGGSSAWRALAGYRACHTPLEDRIQDSGWRRSTGDLLNGSAIAFIRRQPASRDSKINGGWFKQWPRLPHRRQASSSRLGQWRLNRIGPALLRPGTTLNLRLYFSTSMIAAA